MAKRQEEASPDAVLTRIGQAVMLHRGGDREEARNRLGELWQELGVEDDTLHHCTLAHYLADTQDDPADELAWDLRALAVADRLMREHDARAEHDTRAEHDGAAVEPVAEGTEHAARSPRPPLRERPCAPGEESVEAGEPGDGEAAEANRRRAVAAVRGLYPSLHLNLAADYVKLGRPDAARAQLDLAKAASGALSDDSYGKGVRAAIGRLALRLTGTSGEPAPPPGQHPWA
ncbi:hypothetical protein H8N01_07490 [Streptomyces sp. AC536]|uniref:hypothetical protein n=1 Tax=Streptomyces buecherae TaxID=2763006 RepID=UPI00164EC6BB|nr:hypothetical protein [Streptomyces buecherae]MBC3982406.1 hypothetical protein [Streptomyces buecherae]QNJ44040.1 hypothetical protein H7H31_01570 [Streptomyces buecherae]